MSTAGVNVFGDFPAARPVLDGQVESLQKLQKAAQKISSILDLDQLIDNIVNDVAHSFGLLETAIYLHDEARGEMVMGGVHGCSIHSKGFRLKIGKEGMVGYVASTGQMRYAPDVRKDKYYVACEAIHPFGSSNSASRRRTPGGSVYGFASRPGRLSPATAQASAGAVRSRGSRSLQCSPLSVGARRARGHEP